MNAKTLTAIVLLMAAVPAASFAQSANMPARPTPPTLDFAAADADASGGISAEEWTAYATTLHAEMRTQMIGARADALMAAADADGNGSLTRDELVSGMTAVADQRQQARGQGRGAGGRPEGGFLQGMMDHFRGGGEGRGDRYGRGDDHDHGRGSMHGGYHDRGGMQGEGRGQGQMGGQADGMRGQGRGPGPMGGPGGEGPRMGGDRAGAGFARIDANGDGQIDADELAQAQAMMNWMAQRPIRN